MSVSVNTLLGGHQRPNYWNNLGLWAAAQDYDSACCALAQAHAQAIALSPQDRLIDLACGSGASLLFWQQHYRLSHCVGLDKATAKHNKGTQFVQGHFDRLPLPTTLKDQPFDAAICIDAAYHAKSIEAFLATAQALLVSDGRLVFSTIVSPDSNAAKRLDLRLAGIPNASQVSYRALNLALTTNWSNINVLSLDSVFKGFAEHVAQREKQLTWAQKLSPAWLKIQATASLCERMLSANIDYLLISAQRR